MGMAVMKCQILVYIKSSNRQPMALLERANVGTERGGMQSTVRTVCMRGTQKTPCCGLLKLDLGIRFGLAESQVRVR